MTLGGALLSVVLRRGRRDFFLQTDRRDHR